MRPSLSADGRVLRGIALVLLIAAGPGGGFRAASGTESGSTRTKPKPAVRLDKPSAPSVPASGAGEPAGVPIGDEDGAHAVVSATGELLLEVKVPPSGVTEPWLSSFVPSAAARQAEKAALGGRWPSPGQRLRLRATSLDDAWRVRVVRALFPDAGPGGDAWMHRVGSGRVPVPSQTIARIALWYTGSERNAPALAQANPQAAQGTRAGQEIAVPRSLLLEGFARLLPRNEEAAAPALALAEMEPTPAASPGGDEEEPEDDFTEAPATPETEVRPPGAPTGEPAPVPAPPPTVLPLRPPVAEGASDLTYGRDAEGPYAAYRLKKGEALYSAVVVRFTGRVDVQEVNDLTVRVAARSGIRDVTHIPIGFRIRIPLDLLLVEYLPRDDPRRQEWELHQAEVERYTNPVRSRNLEGVAVVLDAGHGGRDRGAAHHGVWEHDYVYDVMCRVKALLESRTRARVIPTIRDRRDGFKVQEKERLARNQSEVLLTDPPFPLSGTVPSVNLRWYLSNSWYRKLVREGTDPAKIVFTSFHADARHPSLQGAMVYVPGAEYRGGRYGSRREVYARYREAREVPYVAFTREQRERSEGLSRQFADDLIDAFGDGGVRVHPYLPVRDRIIRRGRAWVPAVLRCNIVPVEVLIEISNLSNPQDSRALADPAYRQKVAEAYVDALGRYFDGAGATTASGRPTADRPGR